MWAQSEQFGDGPRYIVANLRFVQDDFSEPDVRAQWFHASSGHELDVMFPRSVPGDPLHPGSGFQRLHALFERPPPLDRNKVSACGAARPHKLGGVGREGEAEAVVLVGMDDGSHAQQQSLYGIDDPPFLRGVQQVLDLSRVRRVRTPPVSILSASRMSASKSRTKSGSGAVIPCSSRHLFVPPP